MAKRELPAAEIHVEAACELGGVSVQGLSKEEVSLPSPCLKRNKVLDHQQIAELQQKLYAAELRIAYQQQHIERQDERISKLKRVGWEQSLKLQQPHRRPIVTITPHDACRVDVALADCS